MSESEVPQDAPYSDEEFSSDHEGGYEDFADEDAVVGTTQDAVHEGSPMDDKCDEEVDEEDAERYDGEFDEDEPTVVDIDLPKVGNDVTMREQILTTAAVEPQVDTLAVGGSPGANAATEGQTSSDEQDLPKERDTPLPPQKNIEDDDYADEMENEFPSDSNTPHFEGDMPPKSSGEASDFDVDEFIEDGRRETETLLQEVRTLLQQQQQHESEPPVQQIIASPDMSTTTGSSAAVSENLVGGDKESDGIGDEKYSTPYDDEEFVDVDGEATNQDASEKDVVGDHGGMGNYEFDTDDYEEHDAEAFVYDEPNAPTQLVDPDNTVDINLPPSTIAVDRIQSCSEDSLHFRQPSRGGK
ncbi:hypothetical protein KRP22_010247 [Phytophthora ramorum]|nr:hypothetical protein KRP22_5884 [Phytophthora ramorum]